MKKKGSRTIERSERKKGKEVTRTIKGGNLKAIKEGSRRPLPGFVYPGFAAPLCEPAITVCRAAYVGRDKPFLRVLSTLLLCPGSFSFRNGAAEAGHLLPLSGATIYYNKGNLALPRRETARFPFGRPLSTVSALKRHYFSSFRPAGSGIALGLTLIQLRGVRREDALRVGTFREVGTIHIRIYYHKRLTKNKQGQNSNIAI